MRITAKNTTFNRGVKGVVKSTVRKTREAIAAGKPEEAKEWFEKAKKSLDKAAQKKVIKKNTAARKKSRLSAAVKKLSTK